MDRIPRWWHRWPFGVQIAGATLVVVVLATLGWLATGYKSDRYPAWLEAVATLAALIAALIAARYVRNAFELEFRREQRYEESHRRAQADSVAAWFDRHSPDKVPYEVAAPGYRLANRSNLPIYDVYVTLVLRRQRAGINVRHELLAPNNGHFFPFEGSNAQAVWDYYEPNGPVEKHGLHHEGIQPIRARPQIQIQFRDTAGVVWIRAADGRLSEKG